MEILPHRLKMAIELPEYEDKIDLCNWLTILVLWVPHLTWNLRVGGYKEGKINFLSFLNSKHSQLDTKKNQHDALLPKLSSNSKYIPKDSSNRQKYVFNIPFKSYFLYLLFCYKDDLFVFHCRYLLFQYINKDLRK